MLTSIAGSITVIKLKINLTSQLVSIKGTFSKLNMEFYKKKIMNKNLLSSIFLLNIIKINLLKIKIKTLPCHGSKHTWSDWCGRNIYIDRIL